jgi:hypothetical protein
MTSPGEYNGIGYSRYGYSMLTNLCGTPKYALGVQAVAPVWQTRGITQMTQSSISYPGVTYTAGYTDLLNRSQGSGGVHAESKFAYTGAGKTNDVQAMYVTRSAQ